MTEARGVLATDWQGSKVDPQAVERALNRMLRQVVLPSRGEGQTQPGRASVLSLIVRAAGGAAETRAVETLGQLSDRYPSRTLAITVDPSAAEPTLDAWASVHCRLRSGAGATVCFEQVNLVARGALSNHLASVVSPLLIPDLPVFIWWLGEPPDQDEELLGLCDRLIVDTSEMAPRGLAKVWELSRVRGDGLAVADLSWSALAPWRELLARLFDPPETRVFQRWVRSVSVEHAAGAAWSQSYLLLGWLARCLRWDPVLVRQASDGLRACFRSANGDVEAVLAGSTLENEHRGNLHRVQLFSHLDGAVALFSVESRPDGASAVLYRSLPAGGTLERTVRVSWLSPAATVGKELERMGKDCEYNETLGLAYQLLQSQGLGL